MTQSQAMQVLTSAEHVNRFWVKVKITQPNACWLWQAFIKPNNGYGTFRLNGKIRLAHNIAFILTYGEISEGMCVLHACDIPACVNPKHLFLGTHQDNMHDRDMKKRHAHGIRLHTAVLTEQQVLDIRYNHKQFNTAYTVLATQYHVAPITIANVCNYVTWRHLP